MTVESRLIEVNDWQYDDNESAWYHRGCDMYAIDGQCPGCGEVAPKQTVDEHILTRQDINALRQADRVLFFHDRPDKRKDGYEGQIVCTKRRSVEYREAHPFDDDDSRYSIPVAKSEIYTYSHDYERRDDILRNVSGYVYSMNSHWSDSHLNTIWALAKPGDIFRLQWNYNGGSDSTKDGGLVMDQLFLKIYRPAKGKGKDKTLVFFVDEQTGKDNSARMLRWNY